MHVFFFFCESSAAKLGFGKKCVVYTKRKNTRAFEKRFAHSSLFRRDFDKTLQKPVNHPKEIHGRRKRPLDTAVMSSFLKSLIFGRSRIQAKVKKRKGKKHGGERRADKRCVQAARVCTRQYGLVARCRFSKSGDERKHCI